MNLSTRPVLRGGALALLSAVAFGLTTPLIQRLGRGVSVLPAAALLYAGAALVSLKLPQKGPAQAPVGRAHWPRLVVVALLGAVGAPVCLIFGLQRTDAVSASLLLNFEAAFTVLLAWLVYREPICPRVLVALGAMSAGGLLVASAGAPAIPGFGVGALAIILATLGWALDNTLSRPLAELSPSRSCCGRAGSERCSARCSPWRCVKISRGRGRFSAYSSAARLATGSVYNCTCAHNARSVRRVRGQSLRPRRSWARAPLGFSAEPQRARGRPWQRLASRSACTCI
jgi:uncharacterized membrane protein